jgi:hypothetical protein
MLPQGTQRLVTNCVTDRLDDLRRVSHEALRFGRWTNLSDADDHVSTIRLSRGQSQRARRISCPFLFADNTP